MNFPDAYFAGILDGEGHITIVKTSPSHGGHHVILVQVGNTHRGLIELFGARFGGRVNGPYQPERDKPRKPMFTWRVTNAKAEGVLRTLLPYLLVKRQQAELALEFRATDIIPRGAACYRPHNLAKRARILREREDCMARMRALNKRGV